MRSKHDGAQFWAHLTATAAQAADGASALRIALSHITEHKQAEAAVQESKDQFQRVVDLTRPTERPRPCRLAGRAMPDQEWT